MSSPIPHFELILTLGVDGSGKSTFMNGLSSRLGHTVLEPTSSPEAKLFKLRSRSKDVDEPLVLERRALFRMLNRTFDLHIQQETRRNNVVTSGHRLVTEISHAVMLDAIGSKTFHAEELLDAWQETNPIIPDGIVLVSAPMDVIQQRLHKRVFEGDAYEKPRGFNAPIFLEQYQIALKAVASHLGESIPVYQYDTSQLTSQDVLKSYMSDRPYLTQ